MKSLRLSSAVALATFLAGCSTAPIHRSAMGVMPVTSDQLVFQSIEVVGDELQANGIFYSPLNSINQTRMSRSGGTMKVKMTQAMLREGADRRFSFRVPLSPKIDRIVVGKDAKTIWTRAEGVAIDVSDQDAQAERAAVDFESRLRGVMGAFD